MICLPRSLPRRSRSASSTRASPSLAGHLQDLEIAPVAAVPHPLFQQVIGHPEPAARKQVIAIAIAGERARLTNQPVDDVPVIDAVIGASALTRELIHLLSAIPDLNVVGINSRLYDLADQTAVYRITVPLDDDQAAGVHPHAHTLRALKTSIRQCPYKLHFFDQPSPAPAVELGKQPAQEG